MKAGVYFLLGCLFFLMPEGYGQAVYKTPEAAQEQFKAVQSLSDSKEKADALIKLPQWYYDHISTDTTGKGRAFVLATNERIGNASK